MANRREGDEPATGFGWISGLANLALDLVPGGRFVQRTIAALERQVLEELRARLDRLDPADSDLPADDDPAAILTELLDRSTEQSHEEARRAAFVAILRQLVPDEARILSALSDGSGHPVIHVSAASALGSREVVLSNVTSIGQAAGVQLREMTAHYVSRLRELGLVEGAPEDPALAVKYEILESNTEVRDAIAHIERRQRMTTKARIVRQTLRATALGRELWAACQSVDVR